ncbi:autotransporter outer membrane beta-barrel domain-containing protein [Helicobacter cholecystus]|uniref:autotransporter outer membrane beta-barrel domain-containing protein n=1 Tax=Helicobacter cholecystus TaxID=45498 RepID=UPI0027393215|nr:autotransporter outer membrane beta-barrel domain-containing protein [Helicobacter cholecystus]
MRKISCVLVLSATTSLFASSLSSALQGIYNLHYAHTSSLLNSTMGNLRESRYSDALWLRGEFTQISSSDDSTLKAALGMIGYDHSFLPNIGQDFLGINFEYSYSWLNTPQNTANTFGFTLYNTYFTPSRFYIDTRLKYLYHSLNFALLSSSPSHFLLGSLELGWKFIYSYGFFLQPATQISVGYRNAITLSQGSSTLCSSSSTPLFYQVGSYMGFEFGSKADIVLGVFYDGNHFFSHNTLEKNSLDHRSNSTLALSLQSTLFITKNFRFYLGGKTSFFGQSNIDYSANFGMRILLGQDYAQTHKKAPGYTNERNLRSIQANLLYEADQSRRRIQERTHLKPQELEKQYAIQNNRNDTKIEDEIKYANRERFLRDQKRWKDIQSNEQNYINRTDGRIETRSIHLIRDYNKRELERKYGPQ